MGATKVVYAIVLGFIAIFVGSQLVPQLWSTIVDRSATLGIYGNGTYNDTTETFMEMVPWMSAIGLMVSAVTIFLVSMRKRL